MEITTYKSQKKIGMRVDDRCFNASLLNRSFCEIAPKLGLSLDSIQTLVKYGACCRTGSLQTSNQIKIFILTNKKYNENFGTNLYISTYSAF